MHFCGKIRTQNVLIIQRKLWWQHREAHQYALSKSDDLQHAFKFNLQRIELTREEVYDLIWSEAMTKIAAHFLISDVALKKRYIKHRITVPGRGHGRDVGIDFCPASLSMITLLYSMFFIFRIDDDRRHGQWPRIVAPVMHKR